MNAVLCAFGERETQHDLENLAFPEHDPHLLSRALTPGITPEGGTRNNLWRVAQ